LKPRPQYLPERKSILACLLIEPWEQNFLRRETFFQKMPQILFRPK
jgi:hypothetical protein